MSDDELEFDETGSGESFPITAMEERRLKHEAHETGDEAHAEAVLKYLPCPKLSTPVRVAVAWVLTMKGFSELYEQHIQNMDENAEIVLMRDSKPIGSSILAKEVNDKEGLAKKLVEQFVKAARKPEHVLKAMLGRKSWYVEVPTVLVPAKKRRGGQAEKVPLRWQPSSFLGAPGATSASKLKSEELTGAIIDLVHALVSKKLRRTLEKDRKRRFEFAYKEAKEDLLNDEARNSARARKQDGKERRGKVYRKVGEAIIKKD